MEIGLLGAFIGGALTLLSPCSVMLLPAFFSYAFSSPSALMGRTGVFYLGLITTLVPLGVLAGSLGSLVNQHRDVFVAVASGVVIALGLLMVANVSLPMLGSYRSADGASIASIYALGTMYGLAGVCAGPLLGAVLTMSAISGNALYGGVILLVFAAGMTVPLLVLSLFWTRLPFVRRLVRPREIRLGRWRNTYTGLIGGLLTVAIGIVMLATAGTTKLSGVLGASDQVELEGWVMGWSRSVPDYLVVMAALGLCGAVVLLLRWRVRRRPK